MTILVLAALLLMAAAAEPFTEVIEGWPVPNGTTIEVDALAATVRLKLPAAAVSARAKGAGPPALPFTSTLCRRESQLKNVIVMRCASRRITAEVVRARGGLQVMVRRLRTTPLIDSDATLPLFTWDPREAGIGGACPGDTPAAQAECLLQKGDLVHAVAPLRKAIALAPSYASLRLGDLAALAGDMEAATQLWDRTQGLGPFGRLAAARLCDRTGRCDKDSAKEVGIYFDPLDDVALPAPFADEMVLRRVRANAYDGRFDDVVSDLIAADLRPCSRAVAFCQRVLLEAFRERGADDASAELVAWLSLPSRDGTASSEELSALAAAAARQAGAAGFAANLWSRAIDGKRGAELEQGMLTITDLYLDAGEVARAATVIRYAARSFPATFNQERWRVRRDRMAALEEAGDHR